MDEYDGLEGWQVKPQCPEPDAKVQSSFENSDLESESNTAEHDVKLAANEWKIRRFAGSEGGGKAMAIVFILIDDAPLLAFSRKTPLVLHGNLSDFLKDADGGNSSRKRNGGLS